MLLSLEFLARSGSGRVFSLGASSQTFDESLHNPNTADFARNVAKTEQGRSHIAANYLARFRGQEPTTATVLRAFINLAPVSTQLNAYVWTGLPPVRREILSDVAVTGRRRPPASIVSGLSQRVAHPDGLVQGVYLTISSGRVPAAASPGKKPTSSRPESSLSSVWK